MSVDNSSKINVASQKLTELTNKLQVLEGEYDQALTHYANYLGDDDRIESVRDAKAGSIFIEIKSVKEQIKNQIQILHTLTSNY